MLKIPKNPFKRKEHPDSLGWVGHCEQNWYPSNLKNTIIYKTQREKRIRPDNYENRWNGFGKDFDVWETRNINMYIRGMREKENEPDRELTTRKET